MAASATNSYSFEVSLGTWHLPDFCFASDFSVHIIFSESPGSSLEVEVQRLQQRLDIQERYRADTQVRHFKSWLCRRRLPQDADFLKLFLDDSRLPYHASRSMYIARLKQYGYTPEDIAVFEEAWKDMLFNQS